MSQQPSGDRNGKVLIGCAGLIGVGLLVPVLVLTMCSDPDREDASNESPQDPLGSTQTLDVADSAPAECLEAMEAASTDESLLGETLSACSSVGEWAYALSEHPEVFGLVEGTEPTVIELQIACDTGDYQDTPVCADGRERGLVQ